MGVEPRELPAGTVTFLLTDIEGSTSLVRHLGDRWPAVAREHRRLLREAVSEAGGSEVDARGEEFFFVFRRAQDAVEAAISGQRALTTHAWPEDATVRVRMGVHTGEPAVGDDGGYLGLDVHRTARITAAGHGGQVLCSATTRALVQGAAFDFVDLGEQPMKGLDRAERIFQLVVPDLPREFPHLRTEPGAAFEGSERELGAEALRRVRAGVGHLPSFRRRQPAARRAADICFALRASRSQVPEPARTRITALARVFAELSRVAADADRYLARIDARALRKQLSATRELAVLSKNAERAAQELERKLGRVDAVAAARRELEGRVDELERRALREHGARTDGLREDVEALTTSLRIALDEAIGDVGYAAERLRRTVHRGVYRQGEVWVVRHYDTVGLEHLARFDDLREAIAFAKRTRIDVASLKAAERRAQQLELDAARAEPGAHDGGDFGGGDM